MTADLQQYESYRSEHVTVLEQAKTLSAAIQNQATYETAAAYLLNIKAARKKWADVIKPAVKAAHEAHQRIKDVENLIDEPLKQAETSYLKPAMARWEVEEESRRREEQERINRELKKRDEDSRLALAGELEKSGKTSEAEAILNGPPTTEVVLPKTTEVKGVSFRTRYYAEVVDKQKLVTMIAAGIAPLEFIEPNMKVLNGIASTMKESVEGQWKDWGLVLKRERIVSAGGRG